MPPRIVFTAATLAPVPFLLAALWLGGWAIFWAWVVIAVVTGALDQLKLRIDDGAEFPAADWLLAALWAVNLGLMAAGVWAIAAPGHLGWVEALGVIFVLGLYLGQVGNSAAHELIHKQARGLRRMGAAYFAAILFGHHTSAHRLVHHVHVATPNDPNTARYGESFYAYVPRAWMGSFQAGLEAENARMMRAGKPFWAHPYAHYGLATTGFLALALLAGSSAGLAAYAGLAAFATMQLLVSDYVQHYGLMRRQGDDGRYEPVGPAHSWNAPHAISGAMMLNAPRHSDHHMHPGKAYPALHEFAEDEAPTLPQTLPAMACVAMVPKYWRQIMDWRCRAWARRQKKAVPSPLRAERATEGGVLVGALPE